MPRTRIRKSSRGMTPLSQISEAAKRVLDDGITVRQAAINMSIPYTTLARFLKKLQDPNASTPARVGYGIANRVFTEEQEQRLEEFLKRAADMYFGLTPAGLKELAFEFAKQKHLKYPQKWDELKAAGTEWYRGFMKRHPKLSIRKPVATSLARATSFNRTNVEGFFNQLVAVLDRYKFTADSIYNFDETGVTTVQDTVRIIASKGVRLVGAMTSAERGTLVTVAYAVNAIGNTVPPMFLFPRKKFFDHFLLDSPVGSIGVSNGSGWMDKNSFFRFMSHFLAHSKATLENKVLLILDNHDSHISTKVIEFAKENGIIMLTLPPHCSHKLQPLDRSVFGPFKTQIQKFSHAWMRNHPGKPMTIYDIPGLVKSALPFAATALNIQSGFKRSGIHPLNPQIFQDDEFSPSQVTDRPLPLASQGEVLASTPTESTRQTQNLETPKLLEHLMPPPKAGPLKKTRRGKKRKSCVLTDTPELRVIRDEELQRDQREKQKEAKRKVRQQKSQETRTIGTPKTVAKRKYVRKTKLTFKD